MKYTLQDLMLMKGTSEPDAFPQAHRLALELEFLLLSCKDTAAVSKWWDSAHEALEQWREFCRAALTDELEIEMPEGPVLAIRKLGYVCNGALAAKLWSRFSQDQCATWIEMDEQSIERFVAWICSGLDRNEAWS